MGTVTACDGSRSLLRAACFLALAAFLAACGRSDSGQSTPPWSRAYGPDMSEATALLQAGDGGYVVIGRSPNGPRPPDNAWIMKLDSAGNVVWRKSYDSGRGRDEFLSVQQAANGGYIVTASTNRSEDTLVVRLDERAAVIWARTFAGVIGATVRAAGDGYIMKGLHQAEPWLPEETWIAKLDDGGSITWQKSYGTNYLRAISATADGGYLVAGWGDGGALLMKLNAYGDIVWQRNYGGASFATFIEVRPTLDGGCVVLGLAPSSSIPASAWLLKLDSAGNIAWQKIYDGAFAIALQPSADGGFVMPVEFPGASGPSLIPSLMKFDGRGNMVWLKSYGIGLPFFSSIAEASDGGYLLGGSGLGVDSPWLLKLNAEGSSAGCAVSDERTLIPFDSAATATQGTVSVTNSNLASVSSTVVLTDIATVTQDLCPAP